MNKRKRALLFVLLCVLCAGMICPALAAPVQVDTPCSLTLTYRYEGEPIGNATFALLRAMDIAPDGTLTPTPAFAGQTVDMDDPAAAALTLSDYVAEKTLQPEYILTTDENGKGELSQLPVGIYLMLAQPVVVGERTHYADPQLVVLPVAEGESWNYAVTVYPKSTSVDVNKEPIDLTVVKKWEDEGYEQDRPKTITVRLLRDGQVMDTLALTEEMNWCHTWTGLLAEANWTVEEVVPAGYVVSTERSGNTVTLTNYRKDIDQTGQLWWQVAVLLCGGLVLIAAGITVKRSGKHA